MLGVVDGVNGGVLGSNETNDNLVGGAENNTFFVGRGIDVIDGGAGQDVLNVDGEAIEWNITRVDANTVVMTHPTWGENTLINIESIYFAQSGVTLSVDEAIAQTADLPVQRFDSDEVLNGTHVDDFLQATAEFQRLYGGTGDDSYQGNAENFSQVNYDGLRSEYNISQNTDGSITIVHPIWGTDTLNDITALIFTGSEPGADGVAVGEFEFINVSDIVFDAPIPAPSEDDIPGDISTDAVLEVGGSVTSDIFGEGDTDFFAVTIEAGQTVLFSQSDVENSFNREVTLEDADGNVVASGLAAFRSFGISNSDFAFQSEVTTTYYLSIKSTDNNFSFSESDFGQGSYTLSATEISDDFSNFASGAEQLNSDGEQITGTIEYVNDADVFTIFLTEGETLNLKLGTGVVIDTTVLGPDGSAQDIFVRNLPSEYVTSDGRVTNERLLQAEASETGLYTISLLGAFEANVDFRGVDTQTGEYVLDVTVEAGATVLEDGTIEGTDGDNLINGTSGDDIIFGLAGNDRIEGQAGDDLINGGEGNDILRGGEGVNSLVGQGGDDVLFGGENGDALIGGDGNDQIFGGDGDDQISGGFGNDTISAAGGSNIVTGGGGDDSIFVGTFELSGANTVYGGDGADLIRGAGGTDTIFGEAGDDTISSGAGNDYLVGGDGADVFSFNVNDDHDTIADFEIGIDRIDIFINDNGLFVNFSDVTEDGGPQDFSEIENLLSQDGNDTLVSLGANQSIRLLNIQLDDLIQNDNPVVLTGTTGDDVIRGSSGDDEIVGQAGNDTLVGEDGNDVIRGGAGDDKVFGGAGDDFVNGSSGNDVVAGNDGNDVVNGGSGNDTVRGGDGDDTLTGGIGDDTLNGNAGADILSGNSGHDVINGGIGNDLIHGGSGNDSITAGTGNDTVNGNSGEDTIFGNGGDDVINGGGGNDDINGGGGADIISGGHGHDALFGSAGDDMISGNTGNDLLTGGNGHDVFIFEQSSGFDTITDFSAGDKIDLSDFGFNSFDDLNIVEDNGTVFIYLDANTSIELTDVDSIHDLSAYDFIL